MYSVAALYRFQAVPEPETLASALRAACDENEICGTLIVAREGINGTIAAASDAQMENILRVIRSNFDELELKMSSASEKPFQRMKIKVKSEIVTMRTPEIDPTKNVRFYAYAAWWARAYILRYLLNTYRLIKVGTTQDQRKLFYNLKKEKAKLEREGFAPDSKLLADRLNVRERDVIEMDQRLGNWELSLDQPIGPEQDGTLMDVLPAHEQPADEQLADTQLKALFRRKLAEFITTLDEREEDILRNRILSETPLTLEDMGAKYGITKERTRQLEARIIKRLRDFIKKDVKDFDRLRM